MSALKTIALLCCLPSLLGLKSDFPGDISPEEADLQPESAGQGARQPRQSPRSSSFQSIKLGATSPVSQHTVEHVAEADSPNLARADSARADPAPQLARVGRQFGGTDQRSRFSLDVGFGGSSPSQQFGSSGQVQQQPFNPFQNFPQFGAQPTQQPTFSSRTTAPAPFAPAPAPFPPARRNSRPPPNADPRSRARQRLAVGQDARLPAQPALRFQPTAASSFSSFQPTAPAETARSQERAGGRARARGQFNQQVNQVSSQDFSASARQISSARQQERERLQEQEQERQRLQEQEQERQRQRLQERERQQERTVVVTENPLVLECLAEAEKHSEEIEKLENRTKLHIDYAQEKQIEIQVLETFLEEARNRSKVDHGRLEALEASLKNATGVIAVKDDKIKGLKDDIEKREKIFDTENELKQEKIFSLTASLEDTSAELSKMKELVSEKSKETSLHMSRLEEVKDKIRKLRIEKKNLLQIVQQLAKIGNPLLSFGLQSNTEDDEYEEEEEDEEIKESEASGEGSADYEYEASGEGSGQLESTSLTPQS